ncbi:MAG: hypothetical protein IT249_14495 [Chitinophagaceae bacterium]|nr:hypothetical protein [Chitinophagaceae bacterium]
MKPICLALSMFCCFLFSCKKEIATGVEIRVQNATPVQIEKIYITGSDSEMIFDSLPSGFTTGYRTTGTLEISAPQCQIYIRGVQEPFVSSGNSLSQLKPGQYTCQVTYINAVPSIKFIRE